MTGDSTLILPSQACQHRPPVSVHDLRAERAFRDLVPSLEPKLYEIALRHCRNPAVARDMVQDTFERGLRNLHRLPEDTHLPAWLTRVLCNRIIDHCRVEARRAAEPLDEAADVVPAPEDAEWSRITPEDLSRALAKLPEKFRTVCELFLLEGLRYDAISRRLGIPKNTVGTRLNRGREKLKALLRGEAVEDDE